VPVDFVVLDMHPDSRVSLILGRPFLSTANAHINVGGGEITFEINGKEVKFAFRPILELNINANMINQEKTSSEGPISPKMEDAPVYLKTRKSRILTKGTTDPVATSTNVSSSLIVKLRWS
jgi:hypothetical protein